VRGSRDHTERALPDDIALVVLQRRPARASANSDQGHARKRRLGLGEPTAIRGTLASDGWGSAMRTWI
jgi:hypothetical protein